MKNIKITIKKELRAIIRDKKSLLMMALTPIFIPIFVFLIAYVYDIMTNKEENIYKQAGNSIVVDVLYHLFRKMFIEPGVEKGQSEVLF